MKILLDVLSADARLNQLMHCADVFEPGKQLADYQQMTVSGTNGIKIKELTNNVKEALTKSGQDVIMVSIRKIDDIKTNDYPYYLKEGVQTISSNKKWCMFHELLTEMGYHVKTDKTMAVTNIKLIT